jgi:hypothetical protein
MINYINLTSGLEYAPRDSKFVRIQSSHMEGNHPWKIINDLDYGFLIDAALVGVNLYDAGSRSGEVSRAIWQGVPWIEWAYHRSSLYCNHDYDSGSVYNKGYNVTKEAIRVFNSKERAYGIKKLRYIHKMTGSQNLNIKPYSSKSTLDGKYDILSKHLIDMVVDR